MQFPVLGAIIVSLTVLSTPAQAEAYAGLQSGVRESNVVKKNQSDLYPAYSAGTANLRCTDPHPGRFPFGFKAYGGYRWSDSGVEFSAYTLGHHDGQRARTQTQCGSDTFFGNAYSISATQQMALAKYVRLHGKVGVAIVETKYECLGGCSGRSKEKVTTLTPLIGLGVRFPVTKRVSIALDYEFLYNAKSRIGYNGTAVDQRINYHLLNAGVGVHF